MALTRDGDTPFVGPIDQGLNNYAYEWIRLDGTKAPELSQRGGYEMLAWVNERYPPGTQVRLTTTLTPESHKEDRSFTRYLGVLMLANGLSINEEVNREVRRAGWPSGR